MSIKFSPSTCGFYFEEDKDMYLAVGSWPTDLVDVDEDQYRALMKDCAAGKTISAGKDGKPIAETAVRQEADIVAANERERDARLAEATVRIAPLQDAFDLDLATDEEKTLLTQWRTYRMLVNRVDINLAGPEWPEQPAT